MIVLDLGVREDESVAVHAVRGNAGDVVVDNDLEPGLVWVVADGRCHGVSDQAPGVAWIVPVSSASCIGWPQAHV